MSLDTAQGRSPPRHAPRPVRFTVDPANWALGFLCLFAVVALRFQTEAPAGVAAAGGAALLLPWLAGWITWRVRRRRANGGQLAFGLTAILGLMSAAGNAGVDLTTTLYQELTAARYMVVGEIRKSASDATLSEANLATRVDDVIAKLPLHQRAHAGEQLREAVRQQLRTEIAGALEYRIAFRRVIECMGFKNLKAPGEIERCLATVEKFKQVGTDYVRMHDEAPAQVSALLNRVEGHRSYKRAWYRAAQEQADTMRPARLDRLGKQLEIATALAELLRTLASTRGAWRNDQEGTLVFTDTAAQPALVAANSKLTAAVERASTKPAQQSEAAQARPRAEL